MVFNFFSPPSTSFFFFFFSPSCSLNHLFVKALWNGLDWAENPSCNPLECTLAWVTMQPNGSYKYTHSLLIILHFSLSFFPPALLYYLSPPAFPPFCFALSPFCRALGGSASVCRVWVLLRHCRQLYSSSRAVTYSLAPAVTLIAVRQVTRYATENSAH